MNASLLVPALAYGLMGAVLLILLLLVLLRAVLGDNRGWPEKLKFRQKQRMIEAADAMIAGGQWRNAVTLLKGGFFLEAVQSDADLIERISNHNLGILSRMLIISEKQRRSLANLPIVEDLLLSRREMLRNYLEAVSTRNALRRRRRRETPAWALEEYKKRIEELLDKLKTNQKSLDSQIKEAFAALSEQADLGEITYH